MAVTASLVVNFGDVTDAFLEAEVNEADNEGKTSFVAGDEVFFRIYNSGTYEVIQSAGSTSLESSNNVINIAELNEEGSLEYVTFAFSGTASTDKYIHAFNSGNWIGTQLSEIKKSGFNEISGGLNPVTKKADKVGVAKVDYDTKYDLWKLTSPATLDGSTNYSIVIGITAIN